MTGYAVIDFETTGFSPKKHDRVVEVGVVHVSSDGVIEDHWATLVNPQRDMGATSVHGIGAGDVMRAPTFEQLAPHLLSAMAGRTLVAHNARFDLAFLEYEFHRAGLPLSPGIPILCTMELSSRFLRGTSRKLVDCCKAAGIDKQAVHSAQSDALATAELLAYYLRAAGTPPPWAAVLTAAVAHRWPSLVGEPPQLSMVNRTVVEKRPEEWLDKVTSRMPRIENPAVEAYVDVLERALLDGHLSAHEKQDLIDVAAQVGLHRDQLDKVHRVYLTALAAAAWTDGIVTLEERFQLSQVAATLGIPNDVAKQTLHDAEGSTADFEVPMLQFVPGDRVVFTGELGRPREEWIARIEALGMKHGALTKGTRAVVAADPDSLSGKATKAREYGVPIITEVAFETFVSAMEERRDARLRALSD
jgi:DNA polymerase-3 subunit epsilon